MLLYIQNQLKNDKIFSEELFGKNENTVMSSTDNIPLCLHHILKMFLIFLYFRVGSLHINSSGKVNILSPAFASQSSNGDVHEI